MSLLRATDRKRLCIWYIPDQAERLALTSCVTAVQRIALRLLSYFSPNCFKAGRAVYGGPRKKLRGIKLKG